MYKDTGLSMSEYLLDPIQGPADIQGQEGCTACREQQQQQMITCEPTTT